MSNLNAATYKRRDVEATLWHYFTLTRVGPPAKPPRPFLTRIKRLLELDRTRLDANGQPNAFHDVEPPGRGIEIDYTAFNAFCLALGLDLLDAGLKQSQAVFVLRHLRPPLERYHAQILADPPPFRQRALAKAHPGLPSYTENGTAFADFRIFMLLEQSEFHELYPILKGKWPKNRPVFLEPIFCCGIEELHAVLHEKMPYHTRKLLIQELSMPAAVTEEGLRANIANR